MSSFKVKKIKKSQPNRTCEIKKEKFSTQNKITKRGKNTTQKITRILLFLSSIVFVVFVSMKYISSMKIGGNDIESNLFQSITINHTEKGNENKSDSKKEGMMNILIGGIGGKGHPGGELTDSLMLASFNFDTKNVTLLSIPRDLFVAYGPSRGGKINSLYPIGQSQGEGVNLLAKKVSEITGQPIHHYMIIDFSGFKSIVDALGGVEVDVPHRIYDRRYPTNHWTYTTFSLDKGLQTLDGETALKFARSRHSTSDFDRSSRQQLLLSAIKTKALSLGILTSPEKIGNLISSVRNNLSTDLTVGDLVHLGVNFKDAQKNDIIMYSYNDSCFGGECLPGSFLYQPSMELFDNQWVLLPDGAIKSRLSKYDETQRFATLIFNFPELQQEKPNISIVTNSRNYARAKQIRTALEQLGFPIDHSNVIYQTSTTLGNTRIVSYWNDTAEIGFSKDNIVIQALESIDKNIPIQFEKNNEFIKDQGPRIEIILGNDNKIYFPFASGKRYYPQPKPKPKTETQDNTSDTKEKISENKKSETKKNKKDVGTKNNIEGKNIETKKDAEIETKTDTSTQESEKSNEVTINTPSTKPKLFETNK